MPPISKLFEKCVYVRFSKFQSKLEILSDKQNGSRQGRATQDAIIKMTEFVYAAINDREFSSAFFIEYSKAFDTKNHKTLLRKLDRYGIRGVAAGLKAGCFSNRYQFVELDDELFTDLQITIRLSQGSVPGTL